MEVRGRFMTGDRWTETARNERELRQVIRKVYTNGAINSDSIEIVRDGLVVWRELGGFTEAPHPKYMDKMFEQK